MTERSDPTGPLESLSAEESTLAKALLGSVDGAIVVVDSDGSVLAHDEHFEEILETLGTSPETILGRDYVELFENTAPEAFDLPAVLPEDFPTLDRVLNRSVPVSVSGELDQLNLSIRPFHFDGKTLLRISHTGASTKKNCSLRERLSGTARSQLDLLRELREASRTLMKARTPMEVAEAAAAIADEYFHPSTVGVRIRKGNELRLVSTVNNDERVVGRSPPTYEIHGNFVGEVFQAGEPRVLDDFQSASDDASFDYSPMRSALLLPVGNHAMIGLASDEPEAFGELDVQLGRQLAADVETAMERAKRGEALREREDELRRATVSRDYLRNLLNGLPAPLFVMSPEGVIKTTNESLRNLLDYDEGELQDRQAEILFAHDGDREPEVLRTIRGERTLSQYETHFRTRDGQSIPVFLTSNRTKNQSDGTIEILCVALDATEEKERTRELRANERRLRLALGAARAGIWEWNLRTGEGHWDETTEELLGLEPGEFEGDYENFLARVHPEDRPPLEEASMQAVEDEGVFEEEFRVRHQGGEILWLLSRGEVFLDESGEPEVLVGVSMDITDRKEVEQVLEDTLDEKETLLREIHHRVKNNLQVINSLLSMQQRNLKENELKRPLEESRNRVRAMALVHEHLYQSQDLADVRLDDYLEMLCGHLLQSHGTGSAVEVERTVEDVNLNLDESIACGLIVNELVNNALEHGLSHEEGDRIELTLTRRGGTVRLRVEDNGQGPPEDFSLEAEGSTGLDVVRSLAEYELDGSIHLDQSDGFSVSIEFES